MSFLDQQEEFEDIWKSLQAEGEVAGDSRRRLSLKTDFFIIRQGRTGIPILRVELDQDHTVKFDKEDLKPTKQFKVQSSHSESGQQIVEIELQDLLYEEIFLKFATNAVNRIRQLENNLEAAQTLARLLRTWRIAFQGEKPNGLSKEGQIGLYGELKMLEILMGMEAGVLSSVKAWTGPFRGNQDFQIDGIAIEVKTLVQGAPQTFKINSERQLDETFFNALIVAHHKAHRQKGSGQTLPEIVSEIREKMSDDIAALEQFEDKLVLAKYLDSDAALYEEDGYGIVETSYYRVRPGFPRITESQLPLGIGKVTYVLEASACEEYSIDPNTLSEWLKKPDSIAKFDADLMESGEIEFKSSAWKPFGSLPQIGNNDSLTDERREELRAQIEGDTVKAINGGIVKTVAAFLNTSGGELIIGMADDKEILGVEQDCEYQGYGNLDEYQRELFSLLNKNIDGVIDGKVRFKSESHEEGTTFHILVNRSPEAHFARDLEGSLKGKPGLVFYVRRPGSTEKLEPTEWPSYFAEHF
tara:strand:- start:2831 stop:4411 length:1581 start_codon:yes stop_codon:yes gene_type:complete